MTDSRTCRQCKREKPITAFERTRAGSPDRRNVCKPCRRGFYVCSIADCTTQVTKRGVRCLPCAKARKPKPPLPPPRIRTRQAQPPCMTCVTCGGPRRSANKHKMCLACYRIAFMVSSKKCKSCGEAEVAVHRVYCLPCWDNLDRDRAARSQQEMRRKARSAESEWGRRSHPCQRCRKSILYPGMCWGCATNKPYVITPVWERLTTFQIVA